ncbi:MAG: HAD-IA family hydrolase [Candidatus Eremiobacteraeota bacterium]|nr:HAD-IA family hydrolase [Candidatus Eremiobacteraeota bacterium]MBV8584301.1 HAD-IA family hydrolase [Candidatus Eremiobacteraeota bacterium]
MQRGEFQRVPTYDAVLFDLFGTLVDDEANAFPGARECLRAVEAVPWAIFTSCGTDFARRLIAHAKLPAPPVLITADDVLRNKPAPDGYLLAAERLGVSPDRALVVEDTLQGIAAAREAGMDVVAILRGRSPNFARAATYVIGAIGDLRLEQTSGAVAIETGD